MKKFRFERCNRGIEVSTLNLTVHSILLCGNQLTIWALVFIRPSDFTMQYHEHAIMTKAPDIVTGAADVYTWHCIRFNDEGRVTRRISMKLITSVNQSWPLSAVVFSYHPGVKSSNHIFFKNIPIGFDLKAETFQTVRGSDSCPTTQIRAASYLLILYVPGECIQLWPAFWIAVNDTSRSHKSNLDNSATLFSGGKMHLDIKYWLSSLNLMQYHELFQKYNGVQVCI